MNEALTLNDLDLMEQLYPHCDHCNNTGKLLDKHKFAKQFGKDASLDKIKRKLVCSECGLKDGILLLIISNDAMPKLGAKHV